MMILSDLLRLGGSWLTKLNPWIYHWSFQILTAVEMQRMPSNHWTLLSSLVFFRVPHNSFWHLLAPIHLAKTACRSTGPKYSPVAGALVVGRVASFDWLIFIASVWHHVASMW